MEKQKLRRKLYALFLTVVVTLNSLSVHAITSEADLPALTYKNYKDKLEGFTSKVFFENTDLLGVGSNTNYLINKFVQAIFWVTKLIFSICVGIYELSQGREELDKYFNQVMDYAVSFYDSLASNSFGLTAMIWIIVVTYAAYLYFVKGGSFLKPIIMFVLVLFFNSMFFSKNVSGEYTIQTIRDGIQTVTSDITNELTRSNDILEKNGLSLSNKNGILDLYFKVAIWEPYRYLNADTGENEEDSNGFVLSDRQLQKLVEYKSGDASFKIDGDL